MNIADIKKLQRQTRVTLPDQVNADGSLVVVDVYHDPANHRAYQVDETNRRYREADSSNAGAYEAWRRF